MPGSFRFIVRFALTELVCTLGLFEFLVFNFFVFFLIIDPKIGIKIVFLELQFSFYYKSFISIDRSRDADYIKTIRILGLVILM